MKGKFGNFGFNCDEGLCMQVTWSGAHNPNIWRVVYSNRTFILERVGPWVFNVRVVFDEVKHLIKM